MKFKATNLEIGYVNKTILSGINFNLESNDFVVIVGKNGSGKSTLLKTLSGILQKKSGEVDINGTNYDQLSGKERAQLISVVLTDRIDVPLTVKEVLHLGRQTYSNSFDQLSDTDTKIINEVATELNLKEYLNRPIQELSDGERQKVMIGKALIRQTPIILLDEPTTHLDIENKAVILNLLKKINHKQNKIILISTHDINLILPMVNKLWIIDNKELAEINSKTNFSNQLVKLFDNKIIKYDVNCHTYRLV